MARPPKAPQVKRGSADLPLKRLLSSRRLTYNLSLVRQEWCEYELGTRGRQEPVQRTLRQGAARRAANRESARQGGSRRRCRRRVRAAARRAAPVCRLPRGRGTAGRDRDRPRSQPAPRGRASRLLLGSDVVSELDKSNGDAAVQATIRAVDEDDPFVSVLTLGEIRQGMERLPPGDNGGGWSRGSPNCAAASRPGCFPSTRRSPGHGAC